MRRFMSLMLLLLLAAPSFSQSKTTRPGNNDANNGASDVEVKRFSLLSELQVLASDSLSLDKPLARALAQAEIADVAWTLDRKWAKKLLREAYELTLPPEEEQTKLRNRPVGSQPIVASSENRARGSVRRRILGIANRDKTFGEELVSLGAEKLGKFEEQLRYAEFAEQSARNGDLKAASEYVLSALRIDPSQTETINAINEIAKKDRAAADNLIIQYIGFLRGFPIAYEDQSDLRTMFVLSRLVFPHVYAQLLGQQIPPPGPAVIRAYIGYVIDMVSKQEPGEMQKSRFWLLSVWGPLKQYAPELTNTFLELEVRSRRPNETVPLPKTSLEDEYRKRYQDRVKEALDKDQADEQAINSTLSRGDFGKARKLIDKLKDGPEKTQFIETVNIEEALSLAKKGDLLGAEGLAAQLNKAVSILRVYPAIIERCVAKKDQPCASNLVLQAVRQLKQADTTPTTPPDGIPASAIPTSKEVDPVLLSLSKLAKLILPLAETLALEVLNEMVAAANRSEVDTDQGRIGFESDVFKAFAAKDETQSLLVAQTFKDRLRRIVSLTAVYKWKAEELTQKGRLSQ